MYLSTGPGVMGVRRASENCNMHLPGLVPTCPPRVLRSLYLGRRVGIQVGCKSGKEGITLFLSFHDSGEKQGKGEGGIKL